MESRCSSTIVTIRLTPKLNITTYAVMKWQTKVGNITANNKVKVNIFLTDFISTKTLTWECHRDEPVESKYEMIICRYLLT